MDEVLKDLAAVIEARKGVPAAESYVASLYAGGVDAILKKVGEEAVEVVIAGKGDDRDALVHEVADLWFHCLVLLAARGSHPEAVTSVLARRFGISGHVEKARRG
ncbi:MAG: phosphoribosyl-ATP diphosphatase [Thiotrichales bacterium]|nr:phosphoribosyl-ATP diphosphatase [Thiotrichales bacterium]MCY4285257.1 phosphoribosyl-ATP diphosphatase [Thiotrichales bacterium]MCY4349636.1 phosphoribosyl-ATP diphosphatase [Thiotrichales bacterium]